MKGQNPCVCMLRIVRSKSTATSFMPRLTRRWTILEYFSIFSSSAGVVLPATFWFEPAIKTKQASTGQLIRLLPIRVPIHERLPAVLARKLGSDHGATLRLGVGVGGGERVHR